MGLTPPRPEEKGKWKAEGKQHASVDRRVRLTFWSSIRLRADYGGGRRKAGCQPDK